MRSRDLDACMLPERARMLPEGGMERLLASKCLRQYWHLIFDPVPRLLERYAPDGKAIFEPFMVWAAEQGLSMDWSLHLHLLAYMQSTAPGELVGDRDMVVEFLAAAASRWTRGDHSRDLGILMGTSCLPGEAVLAWKCPSLTEPKTIHMVRLAGKEVVTTPAAWICLQRREDLAAQAQDQAWKYGLR